MTLEKGGHDVATKIIHGQSKRLSDGNVKASGLVTKKDSAESAQSLTHEKRQSEGEDEFYPAEDKETRLANEETRMNAPKPSDYHEPNNNLREQREPAAAAKDAQPSDITEEADISSLSIQREDINSNRERPLSQCNERPTSNSEGSSDPKPQKFDEEKRAAAEVAASKFSSGKVASELTCNGDASQADASSTKNAADDEWQEMPALAEYDLYDDYGRLIARGSADEQVETQGYNNLGGAAKGYTRVQIDEDAQSATSMDDNTAYLFKEAGKDLMDDDEEARNPMEQMQATKDLLTDGQRIAYVGVTRLATIEMIDELNQLERTKKIKKEVDMAVESMRTWSLEIMVRLHGHMNISSAGILSSLSAIRCI